MLIFPTSSCFGFSVLDLFLTCYEVMYPPFESLKSREILVVQVEITSIK